MTIWLSAGVLVNHKWFSRPELRITDTGFPRETKLLKLPLPLCSHSSSAYHIVDKNQLCWQRRRKRWARIRKGRACVLFGSFLKDWFCKQVSCLARQPVMSAQQKGSMQTRRGRPGGEAWRLLKNREYLISYTMFVKDEHLTSFSLKMCMLSRLLSRTDMFVWIPTSLDRRTRLVTTSQLPLFICDPGLRESQNSQVWKDLCRSS